MTLQDKLRPLVTAAFADRALLAKPDHKAAVEETVAALDAGELRVASPPEIEGGAWTTHAWVKEAILLYFAIRQMEKTTVGPFEFHDKIPLKRDLPGGEACGSSLPASHATGRSSSGASS